MFSRINFDQVNTIYKSRKDQFDVSLKNYHFYALSDHYNSAHDPSESSSAT